MGAILDTLLLGPAELLIIKKKYPECLIRNMSNTDDIFQEYRVIIPNEEEDTYYDFLIDNYIAMSSDRFYCRLKGDKRFAETVRGKIDKVKVITSD